MNIETVFRSGATILTDGGIETRLIYEFNIDLPEFASYTALFDDQGRSALTEIYRGYLAIASEFQMPMLIGTPTWRAHPDCLRRLGFSKDDDLHRVNAEAVTFLQGLRRDTRTEALVHIAGVIGPRYDGYRAEDAPGLDEARDYHHHQAQVLAGLGVDLLYGPTFASHAEMAGVAHAMAETGLPYALAPVIDDHGRLLDGVPFTEAARLVDETADPKPLYYLAGCVHPSTFLSAIEAGEDRMQREIPSRLAGLKANASPLPPDRLDSLDHLAGDAPAVLAGEILAVRNRYRLRIVGGCCGTSDRHIRAVAEGLRIDACAGAG